MAFEEKNTWVQAVVGVASACIYLFVILGRARTAPLQELAYVAPMLWTIGGGIAASILGRILVAVLWPKDCARTDVRDREIGRFGEYVGQSFVCIGGVAAIALAMTEAAHFWIAHAVYVCFFLSAVLGSAVKIAAYRKGFPSC